MAEQKTSLYNGNLLKVNIDESNEISGADLATIDHTADKALQKARKIADYDMENLLLFNVMGGKINKDFKTGLELQSKKPLYALENPILYASEGLSSKVTITSTDGGDLPGWMNASEKKVELTCYSKTLESMVADKDNYKLIGYMLVTQEATTNQTAEIAGAIGSDVVEVDYFIRDDKTKKILIIRNIINQRTVLAGYYRLFTVCEYSVIRWNAEGDNAVKYVVNPTISNSADIVNSDSNSSTNGSDLLKYLRSITVKINDGKEKNALFVNVEGTTTLNISSLQKQIIAVQTFKPNVQQLKEDLQPRWIAQRIKYNQYFIASEDVTLKNGKSYYWDTPQVWKLRENQVEKSEARKEAWYWEVAPFLKGGTAASSKYDGGDDYPNPVLNPDVTVTPGDVETANVTPDQIARKAHAVIIQNDNFVNSKFKSGKYYQHSQLGCKGDGEGYTVSGGYNVFCDAPDYEDAGCFYNDETSTPSNGVLYSPKEEILTAYFITKGTFSQKVARKQYDIANSLKNGSRERPVMEEKEVLQPDGTKKKEKIQKMKGDGTPETEKVSYTPKLLKEWDTSAEVTKSKEIYSKLEEEVYQNYLNEIKDPKVKWHEFKYDKTKYKTPLEAKMALIASGKNELTYIDGSEKDGKPGYYAKDNSDGTVEVIRPVVKTGLLNPMEMVPTVKHFSYRKMNEYVKSGTGTLVQSDYILVFGYSQERITTFESEWALFREKFKNFNKLQIASNILKKYPNEVPFWQQVGSCVLMNTAFVKTFFYKESEGSGKTRRNLKPTTYKLEDSGETILELTVTQEEIDAFDKHFEECCTPGTTFTNNYIDEKVDYLNDRFFEMIKYVYGDIDSEGNERTKGYYLAGTPFEIKGPQDDNGATKTYTGYDARELLDYIFQQSLSVNDRDITQIIMKKLEQFFMENKNIDLTEPTQNKKMMDTISENIKAAYESSLKRDVGEADLATINRYEAYMQNMQREDMRNKMKAVGGLVGGTVLGIGCGILVGMGLFALAGAIGGTAAGTAIASFLGGLLIGIGSTGVGLIVDAVIIAVAVIVALVVLSVVYMLSTWNESRGKQTTISPDYVYKFTCRAKRSLRQYTMTKRGPYQGPKETEKDAEGNEQKFGDYERFKCYYNWLAEAGDKPPAGDYAKNQIIPHSDSATNIYGQSYWSGEINQKEAYDGRVAVFFPSTDEDLSEDDIYNNYNASALQKVERFIQTWMGKEDIKRMPQGEIPIEGYYDFFSGMTPYIEVGFRMNLGICGQDKVDGGVVYYDEDGQKYLFKANGEKQYREPVIEDGYFDLEKTKKEGKILDKTEEAKKLSNNFRWINSKDYPYISSMSIKDTGVKSLKLTLFDPNFASYTTGITAGKGIDKVFSLETLIRGALKSPRTHVESGVEKYNASGAEAISNDYLSIDEGAAKTSPTNLRIRYGYQDVDPIAGFGKEPSEKGREADEYFGTSGKLRNARWWDVGRIGTTNCKNISHLKKWVSLDRKINNIGGEWVKISEVTGGAEQSLSQATKVDVETSEEGSVNNDLNSSVDQITLLKSWAQTTKMSRVTDFMITGFSSTLKNNGIMYTIDAIETKDATIMRTRFLQRYAEITANPEEVLYILMHMFNEDNNGNDVKQSTVKIILMSDEQDEDVPSMRDKLNMEYDFKKISESEFDGTSADNIYELAYQNQTLEINEDWLKKITITLGSSGATKNYGSPDGSNYVPLYKTMAQLINEFCDACPPKKLVGKREEVTNEDGEEVLSEQDSTCARPLKWFSVEDKENDITYLCLYYRTTIKPPRIRVYTWGPQNPTQSCVKEVSIKNSNEFAILSAVRTFDGKKGKIKSRTNSDIDGDFKEGELKLNGTGNGSDGGNGDSSQEGKKNLGKDGTAFASVDVAGIDAGKYDQAYASSMYDGKITVLGDPFWSFEGMLQPCTYPIKLNVMMPQSEFTRRVDAGELQSEFGQQISDLRNAYGNREAGDNYWYNETGMYYRNGAEDGTEGSLNAPPTAVPNPYGDVEADYKRYLKIQQRNDTKVHQVLHEMSGYYVVKEITQNITPNSFTTTLDVLSYPNIQKDVILTKKEYEAGKNKE